MIRPPKLEAVAAVFAAATLLWGCTVGPDFKSPAAPKVTGYVPQVSREANRLPSHVDGDKKQRADLGPHSVDTQRLVPGADIPVQWWTLFRCPALDRTVQAALGNSPTLQAAQATLREANETVAAQRGSYFPAVQANYSFTRQRDATGTLSPTLASGQPVYNLHTAQVSVSYVFDIFGGNRRQVESLQAQADAQRFQVEAAYLSLTANVVAAAIQEAALRAQIDAAESVVRGAAEAAQILRHQQELGLVGMTEVMVQEATLAAANASLTDMRKLLAQQQHLLAALTGHFPDEAEGESFDFSDLTLPTDVPLAVPAALVRHRPDVLAAEAQLHAATADVGVAVANMFPQITLLASRGGAATAIGDLFATGNTFWSAGTSLTQTLFAGGILNHRRLAADAALDAAGARYRGVVLSAFQNVADALTALQLDADAVAAGLAQERAAQTGLEVAQRNVELGLTGHLSALGAEQIHQQAVAALAQARANRLLDTTALWVALGGGWWNRR